MVKLSQISDFDHAKNFFVVQNVLAHVLLYIG